MNPSHHSTKRCEVLREELSPEIREQWTKHFNKFNKRKYMILAAPQMEEFALSIERINQKDSCIINQVCPNLKNDKLNVVSI